MGNKDITKQSPEFLEDLRNYYNPKAEVVKKLPDPKIAIDMQTIYVQSTKTDGSTILTPYTMLNGSWHKQALDADNNIIFTKV